MSERKMRWPAIAGGLVLFAALLGCGGEPSVASKSAEAFREAQKKGETPGGDGHGHGHGAMTPGGTHSAPEATHAGHGEEHSDAQDHGAAEAPAGGGGHEGHGQEAPAGGPAPGHAEHGAQHGAHGATGAEPHGGDHAGHGTAPPQTPSSGAQAHDEHAGHAPSGGEMPFVATAPAPVVVPPEQPAKTLQPDALDAPAATSVVDAQRSAEMARGMAGGHGGHGGHGVGRYRHVDAGRGPEAYQEADEPPAAETGSHQHDHGSAGTAPGQEQEHSHEEASTQYVCPMHPEVTSAAPGTCSKCGMALVERRKE
jgi:hypothetical protein